MSIPILRYCKDPLLEVVGELGLGFITCHSVKEGNWRYIGIGNEVGGERTLWWWRGLVLMRR